MTFTPTLTLNRGTGKKEVCLNTAGATVAAMSVMYGHGNQGHWPILPLKIEDISLM